MLEYQKQDCDLTLQEYIQIISESIEILEDSKETTLSEIMTVTYNLWFRHIY